MLIKNARIYTMSEQGIIENGYVAVRNGVIENVGKMDDDQFTLYSKAEDEIFDAQGMGLYPGFIDAHCHIGVFEDSLGFEGSDGNEENDPSTPHLRILDAVNPFDRCFSEALDAGITTVVTCPGSANPIGGQIVAMKTYGKIVDDMVIKAPAAIKFALGENPKTVYNAKEQTPMTRMATAGIIREQMAKAVRYSEDCEAACCETDDTERPDFDAKCEALMPLLKKRIKAHFHAHRCDDIFTALRIAREFDLDFAIVHGTQGYMLADELAKRKVDVLAGPILCDRSKPEMESLTPKAPGILCRAGVKVAIITDHPVIPIQYLPIYAGLAVREGMEYYEALKAITINPAEICGISDRVGSIEKGKDADMVLFKGDPFSIMSKPEKVFCAGINSVD